MAPVRILPANPFPDLVFVDCEASALAERSYPVEVGWALCDNSTEAHLVRPAPEWDSWVWNPASEKIHGIPRARLAAEGLSPREVAERVNEAWAGKTVCSDNPAWEAHWLNVLFRAAGVRPAIPHVADSNEMAVRALEAAGRPVDDYARVADAVRRRFPHVHRAAADALFWAVYYRELATPPAAGR